MRHLLATFGGHRHCGSGDIMFLICHVTSRDHVFKGICDFMGKSHSRPVTTSPYLVAIGLVQVDI